MNCQRCKKRNRNRYNTLPHGWAAMIAGGYMCAECYEGLWLVRAEINAISQKKLAAYMKGTK